MATRPPRRDGYARPLPELAPAEREVLRERPFNVQQRRVILTLLEEQYHALLRRGVHAEVTLTLSIVDGMIQEDLSVQVRHRHRTVRDER